MAEKRGKKSKTAKLEDDDEKFSPAMRPGSDDDDSSMGGKERKRAKTSDSAPSSAKISQKKSVKKGSTGVPEQSISSPAVNKAKTAQVKAAAHNHVDDDDDDDDGQGITMFGSLPKAKQGDQNRSSHHESAVESRGAHKEPPSEASRARPPHSNSSTSRAEIKKSTESRGLLREAEERSFDMLGLEPWLVKSCHSMGLKRPTDVQWNCILPSLEGRNIMASAQTGSGKTAAFALPILQMLSRDPFGVYAVVLTPTRELAFQIRDQFAALGAPMQLRELVIVGGLDMMQQAQQLCRRPHVVIATPGRLADHVKSSVGVSDVLKRVRFLVLDEADRLLEPCFEPDLAAIIDVMPAQRVTMLFSATITASISELRHMAMADCFQFQADDPKTTVATVTEQYCHMPITVKDCYLIHLLRASKSPALIIFTGTRKTCQYIALLLEVRAMAPKNINNGAKLCVL
jgi:hypothetical protein